MALQRILARAILLATFTATSWPSLAQSQKQLSDGVRSALETQVGTMSAVAVPQFSDGTLFGCIIEFSALAKDFAYSQGNLIRVGGSFGIITAKGQIAVSVKIIVHDVVSYVPFKLEPSAPNSGYLISGAKSIRPYLAGKTPSDTPGAVFLVFKADQSFEPVIDAVTNQKVTIAFNRRPGGVDIQIPLDLTVEETDGNGKRKHSQKAQDEFFACSKQLLNSLKR